MLRGKQLPIAALCAWAGLSISCGGPDSGSQRTQSGEKNDGKVLNLYIWADYLAPDSIASFEKLTGIKVASLISTTARRWSLGC